MPTFDTRATAARIHEDGGWGQVAMRDAMRMRVRQRARHLKDERERSTQR